MYSGLVDVKGIFKCSISCRAKSAAGDWNSSRSGKYCLRSKRKGWGEGSKTIAKTVTSVHELYRSPPPRPSLRAPRKRRPHFAWEPARCGRCAPCRGGVFRRVAALRVAIWQSSEGLPRCGFLHAGTGDFLRSLRGFVCCPHPDPPPRGRGISAVCLASVCHMAIL